MNLSVYFKEFSKNIRLAYPVILGMVGHTLISIVDNIMVGKLGATELAAVSLGNSFVFVAMSVGIGFSTAITPIVAQNDARKDKEGVRNAFHHGLILCSAIGISLFLLVYLCKPVMRYMGQPEEVVALASPFVDLVAFSLIGVLIFQGYKQFADGMSKTKYSMYAIIVANIVHFIINFFLIYGIWIFPKWGILGAAVGTLTSRVIMILMMHYMLKKDRDLGQYFLGFNIKNLQKSLIKKIVNIGLPSSLIMFFEVVLFTSAIWLTGSIGKNSQAANQIALSLASMTFMFASGFSVAAMIRVGNQKGLENFSYLKTVARSIFLLALFLEIAFAIIFIALHKILPHLFLEMNNPEKIIENTEVIGIASKLLIVAALFQISDGIQAVVLGALRGLQDVRIPAIITFVSYWIIGFPVCVYLGFYTELKAVGVWIGLLVALSVASLLLLIRFEKITDKLIKK
ncbi:MAG: MATE family efflux transporter [Flavobacteriaceae bacterium]